MSQNFQKLKGHTTRASSSFSTRKKLELLDSLCYLESAKSFNKSQGAFSTKKTPKDDFLLRQNTDYSSDPNRGSISNFINLKQSLNRNITGINALKSNVKSNSPIINSEYFKEKHVKQSSDSSNMHTNGLYGMFFKTSTKDTKRKVDFDLNTDIVHLLKKNGLSTKLRGNLTTKNAFNKENTKDNNIATKLSKDNGQNPILLKQQNKQNNLQSKKMVNYEQTKSNEKSKGIVEAFGICTTQGISRNYNEDRVSVILNVTKHNSDQNDSKDNLLPNCSYFSVFDGHGGNKCANFLRENLHQYILNDPAFPKNVTQAQRNGIYKAENDFLQKAKSGSDINKSGSCVIVVLFVNQISYFVNVGDSRGIISSKRGNIKKSVTEDHTPSTDLESKRIYDAGGKIYRTRLPMNINLNLFEKIDNEKLESNFFGPFRVVPGKLSVSRTIGDIFAKDPSLGGNPDVVVCEPDIFPKTIDKSDDFIILGSDGIFDVLDTNEIINISWSILNKSLNRGVKCIHQLSKDCVEAIILESMKKKSTDNLTAIFIVLPGLINYCNEFWNPKENTGKNNLQSHLSAISKILESSNVEKSKNNSNFMSKSEGQNSFKLYPNHAKKMNSNFLPKKDQNLGLTDRKGRPQEFYPLSSVRSKPSISDLLSKLELKVDVGRFTNKNSNSHNGNLLNELAANSERPNIKPYKTQIGERKVFKNNYF